MKVYRCDITLHDYLFFATTERGKVAETGPFIHNYALTYALGWAIAPWYHALQQPHYRQDLAQVGQRYITPARLMRGSTRVTQYNTLSENYYMSKPRSVGYPSWGYIKCFRPGSVFRCYVISAEAVQFARSLRLGKFMAKAIVDTCAPERLEHKSSFVTSPPKEKDVTHPLLNWDDLATSSRPIAFDILANTLPSYLIANPVFRGVDASYLVATFPDEEVHIPLRMGYYGENVCESW